LLIKHLDLSKAKIVDIGASDGSTSLDLVRRISSFESFVIADLYLTVSTVAIGRHILFYEPNGECVLVVGSRFIGWPTLSKAILLLYSPLVWLASRRSSRQREVLLLNPATRSLLMEDARVSVRVHNVFERWEGVPPDIIKVANLLRRMYFSDKDICMAVDVLRQSLRDGGFLLIVEDPLLEGSPSQAGLYHRDKDRFVAIAQTERRPEIHDLVLRVQEGVVRA